MKAHDCEGRPSTYGPEVEAWLNLHRDTHAPDFPTVEALALVQHLHEHLEIVRKRVARRDAENGLLFRALTRATPCQRCKALIGGACRKPGGQQRGFHAARIRAAQALLRKEERA